MLDIKFIRANVELVAKAIANKGEKADIQLIINLDEQKRKLQNDFDNLRATQNKVSKEIGALKKAKQDASHLLQQMQSIATNVKELNAKLSDVDAELNLQLLKLPNIPQADVAIGGEENNVYIREWGTKPEYDFEVKPQEDLLVDANLADFMRGAKITGRGFPVFVNKGALLERALINFMIDFHVEKHGYNEMWMPFLANRNSMKGTGQLPKLEDDMYHLDEEDLFLIPTAEVPLTNFYNNETIKDLPQKFVGYTPCFRREAGSYGKDTKGLQRLHQFNKVEMVQFVKPEESNNVLEQMVEDAQDILKALGLHYRVISLATGDLSFASSKTFDIEVWAPGSKKYLEVSSVSNFLDFQARRANIRYRNAEGKMEFVHTLNGSGLATPRTFIALIETYQQADGKIKIPEALKPYMRNQEFI